MHHMRRTAVAAVAASAAVVLILSGCSSSGSTTAIESKAPTELSGSISLWHYYNDREATVIQAAVDDFVKENPGVKVDVHSGQDHEKIEKVIATSDKVDVALMGGGANAGVLCPSGTFRDLAPYIKRDNVDMSDFTEAGLAFTSYDGVQCALPQLSDTDGLYFNTDLLKAAGFSTPPKTLDELETMGLAMTTYNADGSIKTLGFNPLIGAYENTPYVWTPLVGGTWMEDGKSNISTQPGWEELLRWQKAYVDKIGYTKLKTFTAGLGDEWSADHSFQQGKIAMMFDGEWRVAFIKDQAPTLNYDTAPLPTASDKTEFYGSSMAGGTLGGISKRSKNPEIAWALLKYLTVDTASVVKQANGILNIPTTKSALNSSDLQYPDQYKSFIDIASHPQTAAFPPNPIGSAGQDVFTDFWTKYQSGDDVDLAAGLKQVDEDINNQLALSANQ